MRKIISLMLSAILITVSISSVIFADDVSVLFDFEDGLQPAQFQARDGKALSIATDTAGRKHMPVSTGRIAFINDGNLWLKNYNDIFFQADVKAASGAVFACLSTQRYSANTPLVVLNGGAITIAGNNVGTYVPDTWYTMTAILHQSSGKIECWFDGIKLADDMSISYTHKDDKSYFAFKADGGSGYIDNVSISTEIPAVAETKLIDIVSSNPENGASGVQSGSVDFEISFDCSLNTQTLQNAVNINKGAAVDDIICDSDADRVTVCVTGLKSGRRYTLSFSNTVRGADGEMFNKFTDDNTITFSTSGYAEESVTFDSESVSDPQDSLNKVKAIQSKTEASQQAQSLEFADAIEGNRIFFSVDMYIPESASFDFMKLYPSALGNLENEQICVKVNSDMSISSGIQPARITDLRGREISVKKDVWYKMEYVVSSSGADVYINGCRIVSNASNNLTDIASLNIDFVSSDGCQVYFDNMFVTNNPDCIPDTNLYTTGNEAPSVGNYRISFNHRIDSGINLKDYIVVEDENFTETDRFSCDISKDGKTIIIATDRLAPNTDYTITIDDIYSEYGIEISQPVVLPFTTPQAILIGDVVYKSENEIIPALCTGEVYSEIQVLNGTDASKEITYVMALCEGDESCYRIVSMKTKNVKEISAGATVTISETLTVDKLQGRFLKVFVWGNIERHDPYVTASVLR